MSDTFANTISTPSEPLSLKHIEDAVKRIEGITLDATKAVDDWVREKGFDPKHCTMFMPPELYRAGIWPRYVRESTLVDGVVLIRKEKKP